MDLATFIGGTDKKFFGMDLPAFIHKSEVDVPIPTVKEWEYEYRYQKPFEPPAEKKLLDKVFGTGTSVVLKIFAVVVLLIALLFVIGYSGVGEIAGREHERKRK